MVRLIGRCLPIFCMPRKKRQSLPICEQPLTGSKYHQNKVNKLFVRRVESLRVTQQGAVFKQMPSEAIKERQQNPKKSKSKDLRAQNKIEKAIKPDDTEFDCETHISDQKIRVKSKKKLVMNKATSEDKTPLRTRTPLEKLFNKTKKDKTPIAVKIIDTPDKPKTNRKSEPVNDNGNDNDEEDDEDDEDEDGADITNSLSSTSSISSEWSTTTYPDSQSSEKSNEIRKPIQRRQSMPVSNLEISHNDLKHKSCLENLHLDKSYLPKSSSSSKQENKRNEIKPSPGKSKQVLQNVRKMINDQSIQEQHFNDTRQRESVRL